MGKFPQTQIYLVRHCEYKSPHDLVARYLPRVGLSPKGKEDAQKLGRYFVNRKITTIYTSPLLRTRQTAQIIGQAISVVPKKSKLLVEVASPVKKITHSQLEQCGGFIYNHPDHKGTGETQEVVFLRMKKLIYRTINTHAGKNIVALSHGDPIMLLIYGLLDHDLSLHLREKRPYIPKGGVVKFVFNTSGELASYEQVNF